MSEWKVVTLDQVASIKSGKRLPKGHTLVQKNTMLPYVRLVDVTDGNIKKDSLMFLEADTQKLISRYIVKERDICLAIVGHTIGMVFQVDDFFNGANLTENAARLTDFDDQILPQFLYYYLTSKIGQQEIISRKVGSAQGKLPLYNIRSLPINLPPLPEQKAIAHILGTLDDKIELNRQINRTLEAMAQTLFKSWFVDFDPVMDNALTAGKEIPDELQAMAEKRKLVTDSKELIHQNPELAAKFPSAFEYNETLGKWIPEGWEVRTVNDAATVVGGGTPSTIEESYYTKDGIPWLSPKDLSGYKWKFISRGATYITELGLQKSSAKLMPKGTVLFSSRAPIGYIAIAENDICTNQGFKSLIPNKGVSTEYLYQFLKANADKIDSVASGSTFKEISGSALKGIEILIADKKILDYYSEKLEPINCRALQIQKETETLTELRDRVLPELISGRVRVKERMFENIRTINKLLNIIFFNT